MNRYFQNIGETFTTLWDGMRVTMYHFIWKKRLTVTLQYPHEKWPIPDRHIGFEENQYNVIRSRLHVDIDDCIGCMQCERACPVDCIKINTIKIPKDAELGVLPGSTQTSATSQGSPKRLLVSRFDIDMSECMYCNLCTYPCPEECIYMVGGPNGHKHPIDYEFAERNRNNLVYQFATATDDEVEKLAQSVSVPNPRNKREERLERHRMEAAGIVVAEPTEATPEAEKAPASKVKPERVLTEPKMDLSALSAIDDRVIRGLAKKTAMAAVREGNAAPDVAEKVKQALEEAGKLTPAIAEIVAQLAAAEIQQPGAAPKEAEKPASPPSEVKESSEETGQAEIDLTILNDISDRMARSKAKAILNKTMREGGTAKEAGQEIRKALSDMDKLDSEVETVLSQLEA
jgi:NADH-quinone oxidoreductase subunit I